MPSRYLDTGFWKTLGSIHKSARIFKDLHVAGQQLVPEVALDNLLLRALVLNFLHTWAVQCRKTISDSGFESEFWYCLSVCLTDDLSFKFLNYYLSLMMILILMIFKFQLSLLALTPKIISQVKYLRVKSNSCMVVLYAASIWVLASGVILSFMSPPMCSCLQSCRMGWNFHRMANRRNLNLDLDWEYHMLCYVCAFV